MNFVEPEKSELAGLRADPLIFEQELDVRPRIAAALEKALGFRAGRKYWRSENGILYAIELGDFGRGIPSMAIIMGFWRRYEPRPAETTINADLFAFALWMAEVCDNLDPEDLKSARSGAEIIRQRAQ